CVASPVSPDPTLCSRARMVSTSSAQCPSNRGKLMAQLVARRSTRGRSLALCRVQYSACSSCHDNDYSTNLLSCATYFICIGSCQTYQIHGQPLHLRVDSRQKQYSYPKVARGAVMEVRGRELHVGIQLQ